MESEELPFNTKDILPKDRFDRRLFVFMTVVIPSIAIWEFFILMQYHLEVDVTVALHVIGEIFVLINVMGNLYYLKRIDASGKQKPLPAVLKPGWRYCHFCQLNSPPRSYHCPVCDECILKRDKHCMFAGCCVGFYNHRYYLTAVSYIWFGALYAFIYQWHYYISIMEGFHLRTILTLIAPHVAVITGFLSLYAFVVTVTQIILFLAIALTSYLLIHQVFCIFNGQTTHERAEKIFLYNLGPYRNFIEVLGKRWYFAILLPFVSSPVPGDGLYFVTGSELEEIKNI